MISEAFETGRCSGEELEGRYSRDEVKDLEISRRMGGTDRSRPRRPSEQNVDIDAHSLPPRRAGT